MSPRYDNGRTVRFSQGGNTEEIARDTAAPWEGSRVLFLQHASDPIVWWSPDLLFSRPDWLIEPAGQDRSAAMRWYPFVTFSQVGVDVFKAAAMPGGHGHNYGHYVLDGLGGGRRRPMVGRPPTPNASGWRWRRRPPRTARRTSRWVCGLAPPATAAHR